MSEEGFINTLIAQATRIATRNAVNGTPLRSLEWIPPRTATENMYGSWSVRICEGLSGSDKAPWDE